MVYNGTEYYYVKNLQGDIVGIIDGSGTQVVTYTYDSWGKVTETGGSNQTLGNLNPFRYRGYYYDAETGLYYLNSRYYDPEVGRFLNADGEISGIGGELLGYNMFTYCQNNPVNMSDSDGNWPKWVKNVLVGAAVIAAAAVVTVATAGAATGVMVAVHCFAVGALKGAIIGGALEKKGIISDRCEINRQIKADNALLRELKATVKKLMQAVKNTVPTIAEAMEKVRSSMLIFSYQLRHIGVGKHNMGKRVKAVKPELERYAGLVQQIKEKSKERKALLAEKKETPFYQIPKLHDLTRRITELTEELEELKTEKEMLLRSLDCSDDASISAVKKEIATLEGALHKLSEQEAKYSAELDEALKQYAELKEQAAGMDAAEFMDARLAIREEKEWNALPLTV